MLPWDEGTSICAHCSTKETCVGDEIGWSFVRHVLVSGMTFSSFCDIMTAEYLERNRLSRKFMSVPVFIQCFFSWASSEGIDFRKPCFVCRYTPEALACDGTKIGIRINNMNVVPIEQPTDTDNVMPSPHNRNQRAFLTRQFDYVGSIICCVFVNVTRADLLKSSHISVNILHLNCELLLKEGKMVV